MNDNNNIQSELEKIRACLTYNEIEFVDLYMSGYTTRQAAEEAGLPDSKSGVRNLLQQPVIARYVDLLHRTVAERSILTLEAIDQRLTDIAMTDIMDVVEKTVATVGYTDEGEPIIGEVITIKDVDNLTAAQKTSLKKIKACKAGGLDIEIHDKLKALDMLIKRRKGYVETKEVTLSSSVQVIACVGDNGRDLKKD